MNYFAATDNDTDITCSPIIHLTQTQDVASQPHPNRNGDRLALSVTVQKEQPEVNTSAESTSSSIPESKLVTLNVEKILDTDNKGTLFIFC